VALPRIKRGGGGVTSSFAEKESPSALPGRGGGREESAFSSIAIACQGVRVVHLRRSTCHATSGRGNWSTRIPDR
jgi:hypothetical protein